MGDAFFWIYRSLSPRWSFSGAACLVHVDTACGFVKSLLRSCLCKNGMRFVRWLILLWLRACGLWHACPPLRMWAVARVAFGRVLLTLLRPRLVRLASPAGYLWSKLALRRLCERGFCVIRCERCGLMSMLVFAKVGFFLLLWFKSQDVKFDRCAESVSQTLNFDTRTSNSRS